MAEIKELSSSQIEITAEIPAADFEKAYAHTLERYNKELQIPGFRPGHVPEHIIREKIGESTLLQDAAEQTIQVWYEKFLEEEKIEAIGPPQASITKMARNNPLGVKLVTATLPKIELPDYKAIAAEVMKQKDDIVVEDKEIDDTLEHLRKSKMRTEQAHASQDNPAKDGAQTTEQKEIEIDDEFAKSFGNFQTLAELREAIRANIRLEKATKKKEEKRMAILERIAEKIKVDIPDIMITSEKNKMIAELKSSIENMGMKWDDYLAHVKKTEEEIRKGWDDQARKRVLFGLILRMLSAQEHVQIDEKELDALVENLKNQYGHDNTDEHAMEHLREYAYGVLKNEKIFQMLEGPDDKKES